MATRRQFLKAAGITTLAATVPWTVGEASADAAPASRARTTATGMRAPGSLPYPDLPEGTVDPALKFDHVVVVMMENHSFDNYFGMLPLRGQPLADGFTFDADGVPQDDNPVTGGRQRAFRLDGTCQPNGITQAWDPSHQQVDGGAMDGFARTDTEAMGYWDQPDIPFYYSFANTFTLGNRAFCSVLAQTYPNRRYLVTGTSSGLISTSSDTFSMAAPAGGTLLDKLSANGITWKNYFADLPAQAIVPQTLESYPENFAPVAQFLTDCAAGTLPSVSFVDPEFGALDDVGGELSGYLGQGENAAQLPAAARALVDSSVQSVNSQGGDEENPQDIALGEEFVSTIVNAVINSPLWGRTLLVWTYDEHGGYYDHVVPPKAPVPDGIGPSIPSVPDDTYTGFDSFGIRVPFVVASPYSRPHGVSNVAHDHTAIIATIAKKWNLPALTYRDANSVTLEDYLDFDQVSPALLTVPALAAPADPAAVKGDCRTTAQPVVLEADPSADLPESPLAIGLPVAGLAAGAAWVALARHRSASDAGPEDTADAVEPVG